jgi:NADPH-dependent 2,4-dienoyl-CoA reductase/sulfur reductase-like enzyme
MLASLAPHAVIVATGALRGMPDIPGNDLPHVFSGDDMRKLMFGETSKALKAKTSMFTRLATKVGAATGASANLDLVRKATHAWMPLGERVVIIGGELVGIELAEFLTERGRKVTVVDETPRFGKGLTLVRRMRILSELAEHGVDLRPGVSDIRIDSDAVRWTDGEGQAQSADADTVVVAKGATGDMTLADSLTAAGFAVHTVGDATGVSYIEGAMHDAARVVAEVSGGSPGTGFAG